jgi:uncharacterized protein (DUF58 family)
VNTPSIPNRATRPLFSRPFQQVRARFHAWFENRLPLSDHVTLTQRTVYILPTRPGLMLGTTLLTLLVASINYQLSLGYLLTFLLAGSALVGMHVCHGTLRGLAMNVIAPAAQHAGATALFDVKFTNSRQSTRYGIGLRILKPQDAAGRQGRRVSAGSAPDWAWTDVPAQGSSVLQVAFTPALRGLHRLPTLTAETRFPLGTFRVWTVWRPAAHILVYPAPEINPPPLPAGEPLSGGTASAARAHRSGEFDGVRAYRRGDALKRVVWKKAAKGDGQGLVVRDTQHAQRHELWLDLAQAGTGGIEQKLSRLCAWVLRADQMGLDYGLRLPAVDIPPGSGEVHKRQCLEALALC